MEYDTCYGIYMISLRNPLCKCVKNVNANVNK